MKLLLLPLFTLAPLLLLLLLAFCCSTRLRLLRLPSRRFWYVENTGWLQSVNMLSDGSADRAGLILSMNGFDVNLSSSIFSVTRQ